MLHNFQRLILGFALIFATSALLLFSDLGSRIKPEAGVKSGRTMRVALLQHASQTVLDDGREGMIAGLKEQGWIEGENLEIKLFNAQGDMPTAQAIATTMVAGDYDLLMSVSTPSLQAVANANKAGRVNHVFGLVTDPYGAGVGISREDHLRHPAHLAGYATMQPVKLAFETAREMNPKLSEVGVVWNASESNSLAQLEIARKVCADMGIELKESPVDNSAGVGEAAAALVARGVQAIWVPGDVTVIVGIDPLIAAANKARIPVFTVIPPNVEKGVLFDVGADYRQVGHQTGLLAGDILNGRDPKSVKIDNFMPEVLMLNEQVLAKLSKDWLLPAVFAERAQLRIDADGKPHQKAKEPEELIAISPEPGRVYKMALAYFAPEESFELCQKGLFDGLEELGFVEGENLKVSRSHAQAEMVNIRPMMVNFDSSDIDVIVAFSTPVLQGAIAAVKQHPVVFTFVTDPIAAGAGKSFTDHHPNVTGIGSMPPLADTLRLTKKALPNIKTLGTLYNSGEANSVKEVSLLREICADMDLKLIEMTAANTSEVIQAAQALVSRRVDAIYVPADNMVYQAFSAVVKTADTARIPLINSDANMDGPIISIGPGYYYSGKSAAEPLARVFLGESPANIAMKNVSVNEGRFNRKVADRLGIKVPAEVIKKIESSGEAPQKTLKRAEINPNPSGKKWKISLAAYVESPPFEQAIEGIKKVLEDSELKEGVDYTFKMRNAQGDVAVLNGIFDAILTERADLVVPLSTPALQIAIRKIKEVPVVFGVVADPVIAGAGRSYTDHLANVTGVAVAAPVAEMLDRVERYFPQYKRLGTLFCPGEPNSENTKQQLQRECEKRGLVLVVVAANTPLELSDAALALMSRPIDAVLQIPDNLSSSGFSAISRAARQSRKPLISLNSVTVEVGAAYAMGRDYYNSGEETGKVILQVIAGADVEKIPFRLSPKTYSAASLENAEKLGMTLPPALLKEVKDLKP
ncbi:MAG: ABC transporter substrate-binding protein [Verrucomicrobiales bacterium]|nr:ABC transporter substrate-binding protein [Verrucomicrobiales bacterium]